MDGTENRPLLVEFWPTSLDTFTPLTGVMPSLSQGWGKAQNQYHNPLRILPTPALTSALAGLPLHCLLQKVPTLWPGNKPWRVGDRWSRWVAHSCHLVVLSSLAHPSFRAEDLGKVLSEKSLEVVCTLPFPPRVFLSLESLPICRTH